MGAGPLTACRKQDIHEDEFQDRRMQRCIPAGQGVPEGEGKIRRKARFFIPNKATSAVLFRKTLKFCAAMHEGHEGRSKDQRAATELNQSIRSLTSRVRLTPRGMPRRFGDGSHGWYVNL